MPATRSNRVEPQIGVDLQVRPERVPAFQRLADAEHDRLLVQLFLERAEQAVPENQNAAVVLVDVDLVLRVMHAMIRWRNEHTISPAQLADVLRVHPELIDQINRVRGRNHFDGQPQQEQRQIEHPAEQKAGTRLPQGRREVVVLALMMDGVRGPQHRDLVAAAMRPVVAKVPRENCQHPQADTARRHIKQRNVDIEQSKLVKDVAGNVNREELGEVAERRAQRACAQAVDRVVGAEKAGAAHAIDHQLNDQGEEKERNRKRDQIHFRSPGPWRYPQGRRRNRQSRSQPDSRRRARCPAAAPSS